MFEQIHAKSDLADRLSLMLVILMFLIGLVAIPAAAHDLGKARPVAPTVAEDERVHEDVLVVKVKPRRADVPSVGPL